MPSPSDHQPPSNATSRFSNRVANYVKYRPSYPVEVAEILKERCGLGTNSVVADIGAGTGILTRLLLDTGATVYAVEPNDAMRDALASALSNSNRLHAIAAPAEETGLPDRSMDLITAAQAFHWFDRDHARTEFERILKPNGTVALIWNTRRADTPFLHDYDQFLETWCADYSEVEHRNITPETIRSFFAPGIVEYHNCGYTQSFDRPGLIGRFESSSYAPNPEHPDHAPAIEALTALFDKHAREGAINFDYHTEVYLGRFV